MGCWVVPSVAAELWGIPLSQIQADIAAGRLQCRKENGFTLVDSSGPSLAPEYRPPTFVALSPAEMAALSDDRPAAPPLEPHAGADDETFDWRPARSRAAATRRLACAA